MEVPVTTDTRAVEIETDPSNGRVTAIWICKTNYPVRVEVDDELLDLISSAIDSYKKQVGFLTLK